jgi:hypothetical protein
MWPYCPDGFEPNWCERLEILVSIHPMFACATAGQLEQWWNTIQCILGNGCWPCRATAEITLLQHYCMVELQFTKALETAWVAGAVRGTQSIRPIVSLSGGLSGSVDASLLHYTLTPFGLSFLALRETQRRNVTGAYSAIARGSAPLKLKAATGVY